MNARKLALVLLTIVFTAGLAADSMADISSAAVLFLRIAPGSRAAGMGESFVAIADDATATHWNPAGLGASPLTDTWIETGVPDRYRPIRAIAPVSKGDNGSYLDYDVWALSSVGLIRYDNKSWQTREFFSTRTDETLEGKVRGYFNVSDNERLAGITERVARANNSGSLEELQSLKEQVLASVPEDYSHIETLTKDLDSLVACFTLCRVNWDKASEASDLLRDGMKDSVLTEKEIDRIGFALEKSRNRFLPEEIVIPYTALFGSEVNAICSNGEALLVGSEQGLMRYNGTNWRPVTASEGLPSENITALHAMGQSILIGTDKGMAVFNGLTVNRLTTEDAALPAGEIQAIGGETMTEIYAVVDGELYRYDGRQWRSTMEYTVELDSSIDKIAERFLLYGTAAEKQRYIDKYTQITEPTVAPASVEEEPAETSEETTPADSTEMTAAETEEAVDSTAVAAEEATGEEMAEEETAPAVTAGIPGIDIPLNPGDKIQVPYTAGIKGRVNQVFVDREQTIWLGTEYGIFYFDGKTWKTPGYTDHVMVEGETLDDVAARNLARNQTAEENLAVIKDMNDLQDQPIEVGQTVRVRANPAANAVNSIGYGDNRIYFATDKGLIQYDGRSWSRADLRGLGNDQVIGVSTVGGQNWIASDDKLVVRSRGRSEITFMHVNWLPELTDDLYYEFLGFVTNKEGWGTFGGNVTFISYGTFNRTGETSSDIIGTFESFDIAFTGSYGTSLSKKMKIGFSAKVIYSRLTDQGQAKEKGGGTSTGFALDVGLLYEMTSRLNWGLAITNIGPKMSYIDAAQSDDLPRNLAFGFAYKLLQSEYNRLIVTAEVNKLLVGLDDGLGEEFKQMVFNGGAEFTYAHLISARAGYIFDEEGDIKTMTLGFGLSLFDKLKFDFGYIPSQDDFSLANTMRITLGVIL